MTNQAIILLAEDDSDDVLLMKRALARAGLANPVHVVSDGVEAVEYLKGAVQAKSSGYEIPLLICLDLRMPLTSGLQFLRAIRAIPGLTNTPVAIVTGDYYLDEAQSNEIRELGAELRYKPLWLEELVTLARELLNLPVK